MYTQPGAIVSQPQRRHADDGPTNPWLLWSVDIPAEREVLTSAELSECGCPDLCDRDHANE